MVAASTSAIAAAAAVLLAFDTSVAIAAAVSSDGQQLCSPGIVAGAAATSPAASCGDREGLTKKALRAEAVGAEQVLLQRSFGSHKFFPGQRQGSSQECAREGQNPWARGYIRCCDGMRPKWGRWSDGWHFQCVPKHGIEPERQPTDDDQDAGAGCTPTGGDQWSSGREAPCCEGLQSSFEEGPDGSWRYLCRDSAPAPISTQPNTTVPPAEAPAEELAKDPNTSMPPAGQNTTLPPAGPNTTIPTTEEPAKMPAKEPADEPAKNPSWPPEVVDLEPVGLANLQIKLLNWNVHFTNEDTNGIAAVIKQTDPDIVGLCELTADLDGMARELSSATGRAFALQPGVSGWKGFGTRIFFDQGRWEALEGGEQKVSCPGTAGGDRAANWVVLRDLASDRKIITGGVHLSYCAEGCDATHECELRKLYENLEKMKRKYPGAARVWMGDLNRDTSTTIFKNLLQGKIGSRTYFPVDDLAQAQGNTYYTGGTPVDHILGEAGIFQRLVGGLTGQGVTGQHLSGADHFPVIAKVEY
jgi:endonuclease/exonuclease/phosphatase family metal-dependent hydrolase